MVTILKANGEKETFSEQKVLQSIHRAGLDSISSQILSHVQSKLYDNIPSFEIYRHIIEFLDSKHPFAKSKYNLKQAIMQLGPTGFPFEDFIASLLVKEGYETIVRTFVQGSCIVHEIDVVAQRQQEKIMVEAKFHNLPGIKTNIHVALYTKARFEDVKKNNFTACLLVTNTKVTPDVISYASCSGMHIISWSYPEGVSLRELVQRAKLFPITMLTSLSTRQQQELLAQKVMWCSDIVKTPEVLNVFSLLQEKRDQVVQEASYLLQ